MRFQLKCKFWVDLKNALFYNFYIYNSWKYKKKVLSYSNIILEHVWIALGRSIFS